MGLPGWLAAVVSIVEYPGGPYFSIIGWYAFLHGKKR